MIDTIVNIINPSSQCHFCTALPDHTSQSKYLQIDNNKKNDLYDCLRQSLYTKYSSSSNYHYTKDINEILACHRSKITILFRDNLVYDDYEEECMNRCYTKFESKEKLAILREYYKFHNDIPRLFMLPAIKSINWYHDKKRRLEYFRIAKMIEDENKQNPDKPPKGIVGDSPLLERESEQLTEPNDESSSVDMNFGKKDKILAGISWLNNEMSEKQIKTPIKQQQKPQQLTEQFIQSIQTSLNSMAQRRQLIMKEQEDVKRNWKKNLNLDENIIKQSQEQYEQISSARLDSTRNNNSNQLQPKNTSKNVQTERPVTMQRKVFPSTTTKRNSISSIFKLMKTQTPRNFIQNHSNSIAPFNADLQSIQKKSKIISFQKIQKQASSQIITKSSFSQDIKKQQLTKQLSGNITPRNFIHHSPLSHSSPKVSPKCNNNALNQRQKLQLLEIKVLTDLQSLQQKKSSKPKCSLQLDNLSNQLELKSLTQRVRTNDNSENQIKLKTQAAKKKLNLNDTNQYKQLVSSQDLIARYYPSGTLTHREYKQKKFNQQQESIALKQQFVSSAKQAPQRLINTSGEQGNQNHLMYYQLQQQQVQQAPQNPSQISTFANTNQSSCQNSVLKDIKQAQQKQQSNQLRKKQEGNLKQKLTIDSQLYKAALNLATQITIQKNEHAQTTRNVKQIIHTHNKSECSLKKPTSVQIQSARHSNIRFDFSKFK